MTVAPGIRQLPTPGWGIWDPSPAWCPDGTRIAFGSYSDRSPEIYVFDSDGSDLERLTNNSDGVRDPAWSPDGTEIAFAFERSGAIYVAYIAVR